jgi:hypothetical protein
MKNQTLLILSLFTVLVAAGRIYDLNIPNHLYSEPQYTPTILYPSSTYRSLHDPSYNEALSFVALDQTNSHPYIKNHYDCKNFSIDFVENASKYGIRAFATILINEACPTQHMVVFFNIIDRNRSLYIEPQNDEIIHDYVNYKDC